MTSDSFDPPTSSSPPKDAITAIDNQQNTADNNDKTTVMSGRFRGFMPVVVDVETSGFDAQKNALLEISAVILNTTQNGVLYIDDQITYPVAPFAGALLDPSALAFTGIDPKREALTEADALKKIFQKVRTALKKTACTRAILVGHNSHFDLGFIKAAIQRAGIKRNPFHPFSCFDTVSLAGMAFGQTVLSRACAAAEIEFEPQQAHCAHYDARKTAELFCHIVNDWQRLKQTPNR